MQILEMSNSNISLVPNSINKLQNASSLQVYMQNTIKDIKTSFIRETGSLVNWVMNPTSLVMVNTGVQADN